MFTTFIRWNPTTSHPSIHSRRSVGGIVLSLSSLGKHTPRSCRKNTAAARGSISAFHSALLFLVIDINNNKKCEPVWSFPPFRSRGVRRKNVKKNHCRLFLITIFNHFFSSSTLSSSTISTQNPIPFVCTNFISRSRKKNTPATVLRFYWAFIPFPNFLFPV